MPSNADPYKTQLDHLIKLAKNPGFKAHAWSRAKELAEDRTGLFAGIDQDLKTKILEIQNGEKRDSEPNGKAVGH